SAGHFDQKPLLTLETRMGYTMFGASKVESRLTLQLPASFRIAGSASFDMARIGSTDPEAAHLGMTLERVIKSDGPSPEAVFYIGFRSGAYGGSSNPRHENIIVAGLFKRL